MYRAYKRTEIASYVRYTCFEVAIVFPKGDIPKPYSFKIWAIPVWLHPCKIFAAYRGEKARK